MQSNTGIPNMPKYALTPPFLWTKNWSLSVRWWVFLPNKTTTILEDSEKSTVFLIQIQMDVSKNRGTVPQKGSKRMVYNGKPY